MPAAVSRAARREERRQVPRDRRFGLVGEPELAQADTPVACGQVVPRRERKEPVEQRPDDLIPRQIGGHAAADDAAAAAEDGDPARGRRFPTASSSFAALHFRRRVSRWVSESRGAPRPVSFSSTSVASARSRLSPPSSRCSPMAIRSNASSPADGRRAHQAEVGGAAADVAHQHQCAVGQAGRQLSRRCAAIHA